MTNAEIAKIFHEMGDILEIQGENPFRIRAYHQAGKTIEFHAEPMAQVYARGGRGALRDISGIGETLADKIVELIETGELKAYQKLRKSMPQTELEIAEIPGVGPKTAKKLYALLKPKSLTDFKKKLEKLKPDAKGARTLGGFKEKSIANFLRGLEIQSRKTGRMLITDALPIAELFIDRLKKVPGVKQIHNVGSLRRMRETVGDVDIIAAAADAAPVLSAFVETTGVSEVLAKGVNKSLIIYERRADVDLEILPEMEYGSLLQHFTGSKEHNIAMRTLTESLGLSFSEHGFKIKNDQHPWAKEQIARAKKDRRWDAERRMILCPTEEIVYQTIGLAWIPPELRENGGEIQAAKDGTLPKLVEVSDIRGDIHVHSHRSGDAREEPAVLIERAIVLGYQYLGITDHTKGLGAAGRLTNAELAKHAEQLRKLNAKYKEIRLLPGAEINIMANGTLDVPDDILAELDVVVASVHSSFAQNKDIMTERILAAIENPHVDILAHPTTRLIGYREEIEADWEQIFTRAAATQTALEINSYPQRLDLNSTRIRRAKELGCKFVISTDTHQVQHLDNMRFGVAMARRGWCEKGDILNTMSTAKFVEWLRGLGV